MANSRDVRLVVKAKDEATATLTKIFDILEKQARGSDKLGKSLAPLRDKLGSTVDSISNLQATLSKAQAQIGMANTIKAVGDSITKLNADLADNNRAFVENSKKLAKSSADLHKARAAQVALIETLKDQRKAHADASKDLVKHQAAMTAAGGSAKKLAAEIERKEQALRRDAQTMRDLIGVQRQAQDADQRAIRTAEVLAARIADVRAAREKERLSLTKGGETNRTNRITALADKHQDPWIAVAARSFQEDEGARRARLLSYDQEIRRLENLALAAQRTKAQTKAALADVTSRKGALGRDMAKADNLATLRDQLTRARVAYTVNEGAVDSLSASQTKLGASIQMAESELVEQTAKVEVASKAQRTLEQENRRLGVALENTTATIAATNVQLETLRDGAARGGLLAPAVHSAEELEARLKRLETRLAQVRDVVDRAGRYSDGAGGFTGSEDAAKLRKLNAALTQAQADAKAFRDEIGRLGQMVNSGEGGRRRMEADMRGLSQAMAAAESDARKLAMEIREVGVRTGSMRGNIFDLWRKHNQDSRTALNLYQRIRGQVLSMIAAYAGLHGVQSLLRGVTDAYMAQEAALSRLGVVFEGNISRIGVEFDWIRRQAQRLGIEFGVLSQEYTKFAVGARASDFTDDSIRKIFTSVAEAGRVNKLAKEDMQGIFLALTQMIGKSKISAEELRQQLGERLPGAVKLMADALGVSIAELDKMMKAGEALATEENMMKFAERLDEMFSAQLPTSLRTFTAELGKLQNTIYQSKVAIGEGGLIGALTDVMKRLNDFANSKEGLDFFLGLGDAMGYAASWIPTLIENFEIIAKVLKIVAVIGLAAVFRRWWIALTPFGLALGNTIVMLKGAPVALAAFRVSLAAASGVMATSAVVARGLGAALAGIAPLLAAGFVGYQIFGALGSWSSSVDDIVSAQAHHKRIMDQILGQYDQAKGKTYDWRDAINEKTQAELVSQTKVNRDAYSSAIANASRSLISGTIGSQISVATLPGVATPNRIFGVEFEKMQAFHAKWAAFLKNINTASKAEILEFKKHIEEFAKTVPDIAAKDELLQIADGFGTIVDTGVNLSLSITAARELGHAVEDANGVTVTFATTLEEASQGAKDVAESQKEVTKNSEEYKEAMEKIKELLPKVSDELENLTDLAKIDALEEQAKKAASGWREYIEAVNLARAARSALELESQNAEYFTGEFSRARFGGDPTAKVGGGVAMTEPQLRELVAASSRVAKELGVSARDLIAAMSFETGNLDPWRAGPVTKWGQHRGLIQWGEPQRQQYGVTESSTITQQVEAVGKYLKDRGVREGHGLIPIYAAILGGHASKVNASDKAAGGVVGNVSETVQGNLFKPHINRADGIMNTYGDVHKEAEKKYEADKRASEARVEEFSQLQSQIETEKLRVAGKEREAYIQEKINAFVQQHGKLNDADLARMRELLGVQYDLQNSKSGDAKTQEEIKKHQEEINRLEVERNALIEQREYFQSQGNTEKVEEINGRLVGINSQLDSAIEKFKEFWRASGSPDASSSIASLEAMQIKLSETGKQALLTADQINNQWADGISNAFSKFAEAIANGEDAIGAFRTAFLQFVGEFLIEIGKMIIKQTILNALQGMGGSGGFGGGILGILGKVTTGVFHSGKAGNSVSSGRTRSVPATIFANAPRFHQGRTPGLAANEMAAIIERDEEILPRNHPRHIANAKGETQPVADGGTSIINAIDAESFVQAALATAGGRRVMLNFIRANKVGIKGAIG